MKKIQVRLATPLLLRRDALVSVALLSRCIHFLFFLLFNADEVSRRIWIDWMIWNLVSVPRPKCNRRRARVILGAICKSCKYDYRKILISRCPCTITKQNIPYCILMGREVRGEPGIGVLKWDCFQGLGERVISRTKCFFFYYLFFFFFVSEGNARGDRVGPPLFIKLLLGHTWALLLSVCTFLFFFLSRLRAGNVSVQFFFRSSCDRETFYESGAFG